MGVIYVKDGQYTEEEILDNNEHSPLFDEFLQIIGDKVRLKGMYTYSIFDYNYDMMLRVVPRFRQIQRRTGHGPRLDRSLFGVHALAWHRDHVSRFYPSTL